MKSSNHLSLDTDEDLSHRLNSIYNQDCAQLFLNRERKVSNTFKTLEESSKLLIDENDQLKKRISILEEKLGALHKETEKHQEYYKIEKHEWEEEKKVYEALIKRNFSKTPPLIKKSPKKKKIKKSVKVKNVNSPITTNDNMNKPCIMKKLELIEKLEANQKVLYKRIKRLEKHKN